MKYNYLILSLLFFSPFMVLSVNSWFSIWMNMEMNLLMFLGYLILNNKDVYDSAMKYFLINCFSSSIFIFSVNMNFFMNINLFLIILNLMMLIKLGMCPFHFWFIDMMIMIGWMSCFILSVWQKFIPMILITYVYLYNNFMLFIILISGILSVIMGMNQVNMKKILSYSSINHLCWMLFSILFNELLWLLYYISYFILNFSLMYMLNVLMINNLIDLYKFNVNMYMKMIMFNFMSLGGLPPFFGFIIKWYSFFEFVKNLNFFMLCMLIFYSLIYLYYYLRVMFLIKLINYFSIKSFMKFLNYKYLIFNFKLMFILMILMNLFVIMMWLVY